MKSLRETIQEAHPEVKDLFDRNKVKANIARKLRHARKSRGMTQKQLSNTSGLAQSVISTIESPMGSLPSLETIDRYMRACGEKVFLAFEGGDGLEEVAPMFLKAGSYTPVELSGDESKEFDNCLATISKLLERVASQTGARDELITMNLGDKLLVAAGCRRGNVNQPVLLESKSKTFDEIVTVYQKTVMNAQFGALGSLILDEPQTVNERVGISEGSWQDGLGVMVVGINKESGVMHITKGTSEQEVT